MFRLVCLNNVTKRDIYSKNIFIHPRKSAGGFNNAFVRTFNAVIATMKFTLNLNKKEFSMKKAKMLSLTASLVLAIIFTLSCSSDDGGGGDPQSYNYCIYNEAQMCFAGPYKDCPAGGIPGNSCPYGDVEPSNSSGGTALSSSDAGQSSSSSVEPSSSSAPPSKGNDIGNYRTVVIGTQTWMAENLNYDVEGSKCNGEGGQIILDFDENGNPITTKTLSNAEVQTNCDKYGRLYDWATAMALPLNCNMRNSCSIQPKHKGICPNGWHIPSNDDWDTLLRYVDNENGGYGEGSPYDSYTAGRYLKTANSWNWNDYDDISGNGTDRYGFSALPGGGGSAVGFMDVGYIGFWWSASQYDSNSAYHRSIEFEDEGAYRYARNKSNLFSVRCVRD